MPRAGDAFQQAELTRPLCEPALSPFPLVDGERRIAETVDLLAHGDIARHSDHADHLPRIVLDRHFGGRDHTTVLHACTKIARGEEVDESIARLLWQLVTESTVLAAFGMAVIRHESGSPERCPNCGSYNLDVGFNPELARPYVSECEECGWQSPELR